MPHGGAPRVQEDVGHDDAMSGLRVSTPRETAPEVQPRPAPQRRKLPRIALVGAGLGLAFLFAPAAPQDHPVVLRLDDATTITGVDLTWSRADDATPLRGATWRFEPGKAPSQIETNARLPNGSYRLDLSVSRTDGATALQRTLTLDESGALSIPVR